MLHGYYNSVNFQLILNGKIQLYGITNKKQRTESKIKSGKGTKLPKFQVTEDVRGKA